MSNQERVLSALAEVVGCCSPLARQPLSAEQSVELARMFLISGERRGTWIYYRVHPEALGRLSAVLVPDTGQRAEAATATVPA